LPLVAAKEEVPFVETTKAAEPEPAPRFSGAPRILAPPVEPTTTGKRMRCPQCNAIYNGDLVSYCVHHVVPLVEIDAPPVVTEKPKSNETLFWILLVVTLLGSVLAGSLITRYLYKTNQPATPSVAVQQPPLQKGRPQLGAELAGKAVSLPEAECPLRGPEPVSGTVTVRIIVDKNGQVNWAQGSGGDWLMRGAATEAAMKSTFAPQKLRGREVEGTITYSFIP
jgi:hypothetical protein